MFEIIKNLFSRELTEEEKIKYNIANYKQQVETIQQEKPNGLEKIIKTITDIFK